MDPRSWSCFGRLWDDKRVECKGGFDLAYSDPHTNSCLRPQCSQFNQCKRAKESGVQWQPRMLPVYGVAQHQNPPIPPPVPPVPVTPQMVPPAPPTQVFQRMMPQVNYNQPNNGYAPPWLAQYGPQQVPLQHQQPGAQMPSYLAVPEPIDSGPWWSRLLVEMLRSMGKAVGHAAASFFDHNPVRMHKTPQQTQPQQPQQPQQPNP